MKTHSLKAADINRFWHLIDASDQTLGRLATKIVSLLMGKDKPYFVRHLDCGDWVVVTNARQVKVTGRKASQKLYSRHSGYPGGFKQISFEKQMALDPTKVIKHAVSGMLPKNKLRRKMLARLRIYADEKHPYKGKFK
jgi:large subunit ribosomal protein L13